jgi:hypothetical protein
MDTGSVDAGKFQAWWKSLTTKARKAIAKRQQRKAEKKAARAAFRAAGTTGYCCPKCYRWHANPAARAECRKSHLPKVETEALVESAESAESAA